MIRIYRRFIVSMSERHMAVLAVMLCLPAFFLNLGMIAFIGDEAIRSLVAFEMKLSGNFIVPTLNGEAYFNKPPLYNWFIYLVSSAFGYFGEWPTRVTTLIFLGLFAYTVYHYVRKQFDQLTALTMAMMLLTSGRILLWDSMLGLIDICFSWIIYLNFMILYTLGKAQRWKALFILSYFLFSIAFLLKGLPAVVFQGISILSALQLHGVLKRKVFSADHWIGIGLGIIPVLLYYVLYASQVNLQEVFGILLDQSMQRTGTHHGLWKTFTHIFTFPLEQSYHFLPWSLLVIMTFHPQFRLWMRQHEFIRFNFWMLVANLPVYWLSVQVYPRYVLMFVPLFNMVGYYILVRSREDSQSWWKTIRYIFLGLMALACIATVFMPISQSVRELPGIVVAWIAGSVLMAGSLLAMWYDERRTFLWFTICLLVVRSLFNVIVLPLREQDHPVNLCREDCRRVTGMYGQQTWYLYKETFTHQVARFYTSAYSGQIIRPVDAATDPEAIYLVDTDLYPDFPGIQVDSVLIEGNRHLALMRTSLK